MKVGIVNNETWAFFREIADDLGAHHELETFEWNARGYPFFRERLNKRRWELSFRRFLQSRDVAFFEWASEALAAATALPKTCKIVTRLHRYELYQWADRVDWTKVDRIILVSRAKRDEFLRRFPGQRDKVVVIPEAICIERFPMHRRESHTRLGILCHLSPRKRVYELILAFSQMVSGGSALTLDVGGAGHPRFPDYEPTVRSLVNKLQLGDRVRFHGQVHNPQAWYSGIDLFLSNSYSEGLQVAPMEAIASGADCLSHFWDGADELLPQEHLFTTDDELLEKVAVYCDATQEERQRRQAVLREKVISEFDIHVTKAQIRAVVEAAARD